MPEERAGDPDCYREHFITWRGLILFLQPISQKKKKDCISQNALEERKLYRCGTVDRCLCGTILMYQYYRHCTDIV